VEFVFGEGVSATFKFPGDNGLNADIILQAFQRRRWIYEFGVWPNGGTAREEPHCSRGTTLPF
jgi:hypothetical protein